MVDLAPRPLSAASVWEGALVAGATARLTRLVVADDLGQWWIKDPLQRLAEYRARQSAPTWVPPSTADRITGMITAGEAAGSLHYPMPRWSRYLDGLDCPHCVGFWVGAGVLAVTAATRGTRLQRPWRLVMASLALNAVVVSAGRAVDYWSGGEE